MPRRRSRAPTTLTTIIAMATTGPFIQLCLPYGQKFTDFILINKDESQEELSMNTF